MKLNTVVLLYYGSTCTSRLDFWVDALHPPQIPMYVVHAAVHEYEYGCT
jgi:hypothetical protein